MISARAAATTFVKEMKARGIEVVADISTEQGQVDFGSDVIKLKNVKADAGLRLHQ